LYTAGNPNSLLVFVEYAGSNLAAGKRIKPFCFPVV
jgi:hypothetical protein